jgi:hypothetical protein
MTGYGMTGYVVRVISGEVCYRWRWKGWWRPWRVSCMEVKLVMCPFAHELQKKDF